KLSGFELMVSDEIFRGRYRNSYEKPEAIAPNQVTPFTIDLHSTNHVFKKGHRIMVQVQSTWFPLYDRNPQKFVPNIFEAKDADYQKATQTIYRSTKYPSSVVVDVLPAGKNWCEKSKRDSSTAFVRCCGLTPLGMPSLEFRLGCDSAPFEMTAI